MKKALEVLSRLIESITFPLSNVLGFFAMLITSPLIFLWYFGFWLWNGNLTYEQRQKYDGDVVNYLFNKIYNFFVQTLNYPSHKLLKIAKNYEKKNTREDAC